MLASLVSNVEDSLKAIGESERAQRLNELRESLDDSELRAVIFGEFNHGKSTLINAFLGRIILPAKLIPTTGHVTRVVFGTSEQVRVRFLDKRMEICELSRLESFSSLNHDGAVREDIEIIEVAVNSQLLKNELVLIDTPGLNEHEAQTYRAKNAIAKADLVLLVLNAQGLLNSDERSLASDWLSRELGKPVALVVNFMNRLGDKDKSELRARLTAWCKDKLPSELGQAWFEVNALDNLKHVLGINTVAPGDDFDALKNLISNLTGTGRRQLQHRVRRSQLLAEVRNVSRENNAVLERLQKDAQRLKDERIALQQDLQERCRRFEATVSVLRERLKLSAGTSLNEQLNNLVTIWFKGESQESLAANASRWYERKLSEAIDEIQSKAQELLLELAGESTLRPEPLTVKERMKINARLSVDTQISTSESGSEIARGAAIGAFVGTTILPGVGTLVGGLLGGIGSAISRFFDSPPEPDYAAAYSGKASEAWATDSQKVISIALEQFAARTSELKEEITTLLTEVEALLSIPQADELTRREALNAALKDCQSELQRSLHRKIR